MGRGAEHLRAFQDQARTHPTRRNILALIAQDRGRSLDPDALRRALPDRPSPATVRYHLLVLDHASLLPSQPPIERDTE